MELKARENFHSDVKNGLRLSVDEIISLRPEWKKVYQSELIKEDRQVQKQVDGTIGLVTQERKSIHE